MIRERMYMAQQRRWIARWASKTGGTQTFMFYSEPSLIVARVDLQLKLFDLGIPIPTRYTLEDAALLSSTIPRLVGA